MKQREKINKSKIKFSNDALLELKKVPQKMYHITMNSYISWAKENNYKIITKKEIELINNERKGKK